MKKTLSIIAAGLLLVGCSTTPEDTPPPARPERDFMHWESVSDFRYLLTESNVQCVNTELGTNQTTGWNYIRCETDSGKITAIVHDNPDTYIDSEFMENVNADRFTFVNGDNWVASCLGDIPNPCWDVLVSVTGSKLTNKDKAWIYLGRVS